MASVKIPHIHRAMVQHVAASLGHSREVRASHSHSECVDFGIIVLPGKRETRLVIRNIWGDRWICFLYKDGFCFAQSDGSDGDPTPAQATPATAYHDLLRRLREQLVEKQALTDTLSMCDVLGTPF